MKLPGAIFLVCVAVLAATQERVGQENYYELDQVRFSYMDIELMRVFHDHGPENWVMSPASIKTALSLVYEGTNGQTMDELAMAMRLPEGNTSARGQLIAYQRRLNSPSNLASVRSANRVLVRKDLKIKESYSNSVSNNYKAEITSADFSNAAGIVKDVNAWCKEITKGAIPQLISEGSLTADTSLLIVNALYFQSKWRTGFDYTSKGCFKTPKNNCVKTDMMRVTGVFRQGFVNNLNSYVLELPYQDRRYSLIIVLPRRLNGLSQLVRDLSHNPLSPILEHLPFADLVLSIPKFTAEFSQSLKSVLTGFGVKTMFSDAADLSGILETPLNTKITDVIHKAKIDITEDGTTASAGTTVFAETLSAQMDPVPFKVDHPFLFFIHDSTMGFLFGGQYSMPTDSQNKANELTSELNPVTKNPSRGTNEQTNSHSNKPSAPTKSRLSPEYLWT